MQASLACLQYQVKAVELDVAGKGVGVIKTVF